MQSCFVCGIVAAMNLNYVKIEAEMKRLGLTHQGLADLMDVKRQAVTYWLKAAKREKTGYHFDTIEKFATALNLDPKDLIVS